MTPQEDDNTKRHRHRAREDGQGFSPRSPGNMRGPTTTPLEGVIPIGVVVVSAEACSFRLSPHMSHAWNKGSRPYPREGGATAANARPLDPDMGVAKDEATPTPGSPVTPLIVTHVAKGRHHHHCHVTHCRATHVVSPSNAAVLASM